MQIIEGKGSFTKRKTRYLLLLFLLSCLQLGMLCVETRAQVVCRIASLDCPSEAAGGRRFTLTVTVDYSFPSQYSLRVDVWEGDYSSSRTWYLSDALGKSEITELLGSGSRKFSVELSAPSSSKEWSLTVIASYRAPYETSSNWHFRAENGYKSFTVLIYTRCRVRLRASPVEIARYAKMLGEGEYDADSTVTLKVDKMVQGAPGIRYVFLYWMVDSRRYDTDAPTILVDNVR